MFRRFEERRGDPNSWAINDRSNAACSNMIKESKTTGIVWDYMKLLEKMGTGRFECGWDHYGSMLNDHDNKNDHMLWVKYVD